MLLNQDSARDYLTLQKSLGILETNNHNIKILDDETPQPKASPSKAKLGHLSVHFTPKPAVPNTILGFHEEKVEISSFGGDAKK
jgi:hypothetical protein